ncbi:hypothetical protein EI94DRAFT_1327547 [Lactarius quietus]|nr:hypothetical protein EI94DRAFT_1327547 [Lactarius quietus]
MSYCDRCNRRFPRLSALEQHKESSRSHWPCSNCNVDFKSQDALRQHFRQSPNHSYCEVCDRPFTLEVSRRQHMEDRHRDCYCRKHDEVFKSKSDLHSHFRQSPDHYFCFDCEWDFGDEDMLKDHSAEEHHRRSTWISCLPSFRHISWLWTPNASTEERQEISGGENGASRGRAQGARGYGSV